MGKVIGMRMFRVLLSCALSLLVLALVVPASAQSAAAPEAAYASAVKAFDEGDYLAARPLFEDAAGHGQSNLYLLWIEGYERLGAEELDDAATIYDALASRSFLNSADMLAYTRARLMERAGDLSGAIEGYRVLDVLDSVNRQIDLTRQLRMETPTPAPTPTPSPAGRNELAVAVDDVERRLPLSGVFVQTVESSGKSFLHVYFSENSFYINVDIPVDMKGGQSVDQHTGVTSYGWLYGLQVTDHSYSPYREYNASNSIHDPYGPDPSGSSFRIDLDSISADGRTYRGTLSGALFTEAGERLVLSDGAFCFELEDEDLADVRRGRVAPTPTPAPTPYYAGLGKGDEGWAVTRLQNRLIELGYLRDTADGEYGALTEQAVSDFQRANGLSSDGYADSATQVRLFSVLAAAYREPDVALVVKRPTSWGEWKSLSKDRMKFRIEVQNVSTWRTVKSFELYCYPGGQDGANLLGDRVYYKTTKKSVKPGQTVKCDYFTMDYRSSTDEVYCGVRKVTYSDGTVAVNDTVDYGCWSISW